MLKWPDGRCYVPLTVLAHRLSKVGHFRDEAMHGVGMLNWSDEQGACSYKAQKCWARTVAREGYFEDNLFHGHGRCLRAAGG